MQRTHSVIRFRLCIFEEYYVISHNCRRFAPNSHFVRYLSIYDFALNVKPASLHNVVIRHLTQPTLEDSNVVPVRSMRLLGLPIRQILHPGNVGGQAENCHRFLIGSSHNWIISNSSQQSYTVNRAFHLATCRFGSFIWGQIFSHPVFLFSLFVRLSMIFIWETYIAFLSD